MPFLLVALAVILLPALILILLPFSILQRYRAGTARRPGRRWVAVVNFLGMMISVGIFLFTAGISNFWIEDVLQHSALGLGGGLLLGAAGLALTRWEIESGILYYTPNRWLILAMTIAVAARICFGFWRTWHAWSSVSDGQSWLAESGLGGSMAAGGVVLGYYLSFWAGVWIAIGRFPPQSLR